MDNYKEMWQIPYQRGTISVEEIENIAEEIYQRRSERVGEVDAIVGAVRDYLTGKTFSTYDCSNWEQFRSVVASLAVLNDTQTVSQAKVNEFIANQLPSYQIPFGLAIGPAPRKTHVPHRKVKGRRAKGRMNK